MTMTLSGTRIRKELGRQIPGHRLTLSDAFHFVQVQPDNPGELNFIVGFAARHEVPVLPVPCRHRESAVSGWHIRVDFHRMSAITDFSAESGLVAAQAGTRVQDLQDWLMDKGYALAVRPDATEDLSLWEFLLAPESGHFGPRFGCKWEQVFSLTAVLPNGRTFRNSLAPARAAGPDYSRLVLLGRGAFGIPLEVYLKVYALPRRRQVLSFALSDFARGVKKAWQLAAEARPEFLEIGINRQAPGDLPSCFALVELWGEGAALAARKERVRKIFGEIATPTEIPYEVLFGFEDTYQFDLTTTAQFFLDRDRLDDLLQRLFAQPGSAPERFRVRGFVDHHACITGECLHESSCEVMEGPGRQLYAAPDAEALMDQVRQSLDPAGIFAAIPSLWPGTGGRA